MALVMGQSAWLFAISLVRTFPFLIRRYMTLVDVEAVEELLDNESTGQTASLEKMACPTVECAL